MISIRVNGFDWDEANWEKCQNHGLSQKEIEYFFQQKEVYVTPDLKHSDDEERYLAIGCTKKHRPMFVVFTLRDVNGEILIRPISARYMHEKEAKRYEEEIAKIEKR
jgi:uncharacterized protein